METKCCYITGCFIWITLLIIGIIFILPGGCAKTKEIKAPLLEINSLGDTLFTEKIIEVEPYGFLQKIKKLKGLNMSFQ